MSLTPDTHPDGTRRLVDDAGRVAVRECAEAFVVVDAVLTRPDAAELEKRLRHWRETGRLYDGTGTGEGVG